MNSYRALSVLSSFLLVLTLSFSSVNAQSPQATLNKLNQYENKVDQLEDRVNQANAIYNSLMSTLANNPNACISSQFCALQSKITQFNGPLNVMRVKSNQLREAGLLMGTAAASTQRYAIEQAIDGNASAASASSVSLSSMTTIGDELDAMRVIIEGCIRREIQQIRQNL